MSTFVKIGNGIYRSYPEDSDDDYESSDDEGYGTTESTPKPNTTKDAESTETTESTGTAIVTGNPTTGSKRAYSVLSDGEEETSGGTTPIDVEETQSPKSRKRFRSTSGDDEEEEEEATEATKSFRGKKIAKGHKRARITPRSDEEKPDDAAATRELLSMGNTNIARNAISSDQDEKEEEEEEENEEDEDGNEVEIKEEAEDNAKSTELPTMGSRKRARSDTSDDEEEDNSDGDSESDSDSDSDSSDDDYDSDSSSASLDSNGQPIDYAVRLREKLEARRARGIIHSKRRCFRESSPDIIRRCTRDPTPEVVEIRRPHATNTGTTTKHSTDAANAANSEEEGEAMELKPKGHKRKRFNRKWDGTVGSTATKVAQSNAANPEEPGSNSSEGPISLAALANLETGKSQGSNDSSNSNEKHPEDEEPKKIEINQNKLKSTGEKWKTFFTSVEESFIMWNADLDHPYNWEDCAKMMIMFSGRKNPKDKRDETKYRVERAGHSCYTRWSDKIKKDILVDPKCKDEEVVRERYARFERAYPSS